MIKKVLLIAAALILAISCSKNNPTTPTNNGDTGIGNTGGGSIIEEGTGTSSPTTIADFLNKHAGTYHNKENSGAAIRIENGEIYYDYNMSSYQFIGKKTLSDNKLQIYGQNEGYSDINPYIYIFNFYDDSIKLYNKDVLLKEAFNKPNELVQIKKVAGLSAYEGNYYSFDRNIQKEYIHAIDKDGYFYGLQEFKDTNPTVQLKGNILEISYQQYFEGKTHSYRFTYILQNDIMIYGDLYYNGEYLDEYTLFTK